MERYVMRVSHQWLKTFIDTDLAPQEIAHTLTMAGLEVDSLTPAVEATSHVVVAQIKSLKPHPDADRLQVLTVDAGGPDLLQIVTAAKNVYEGMKVPLAMIGAQLVGGLKIQKSKLRGELSEGMLCGANEIGLSDESGLGIMELPTDAPIGCCLKEYLKLDDWVYDIDLTPNRSDCLSMQGVARDLSALLNAPLKQQTWKDPIITTSKKCPAIIEAIDACPRFCLQTLDGVDAKIPSPLWIKEYLRRAGLKSINNIVDVINFVMLETGQPMHAYDADKLAGPLTVRFAKDQETFKALDEKDYLLNPKQLVIADATGPVAIAGVMGGAASSVTCQTKNIVIESAYFTPAVIMSASRDLALHTQSAYRFERGVNPSGQKEALARAVSLILDIAKGQAGPVNEVVITDSVPKVISIELRLARIKKILGIEVEANLVKQYLEKLGFACQKTADGFMVVVPSFRVDVSCEVDLIEEIARVVGYDNIKATQGKVPLFIPKKLNNNPLVQMTQLLRAKGFHECINYAFISEEQFAWTNFQKPSALLTLLNPISQTLSIMRNSLWPNLLQTAIDNQRFGHATMAFYETGLCFTVPHNTTERVQSKHLAALWTGEVTRKQWSQESRVVDFFDLKAVADQLGKSIGFNFEFTPAVHLPCHPGVCADIWIQSAQVGKIGQLHPGLQKSLGFRSPVFLMDLDLSKIDSDPTIHFKEIPVFPSIKRDLCFVLPDYIQFSDFEGKLQDLGGELLASCQLFDNYQASDLPADHKSWAFRLTFLNPKRTLEDTEINVMIEKMVKGLTEQFDAHLRI
jgi:phenylalanyl-tRNA synthetase beta chain